MKRVRADQEAQRSLAALIRKIFDTKICPKMDAPPDPTPEKLKNRILFEITGRSNDDFSLGPQFRVFTKKRVRLKLNGPFSLVNILEYRPLSFRNTVHFR